MSGLRKIKGSVGELYDTVFEGVGIEKEPVLLLPLMVQALEGPVQAKVSSGFLGYDYWIVYMQSGAVLYLDEASGQALRGVLGW